MLALFETFCAVAEAGSLTRAAEHLSLGQPAVTRQLRTLERQLGAVLLTRTPQGVRLTPAGRAVLPHARQVVAAARACQQAAAEWSAGHTRRLRVAAGLMAMQYVLPPVVAAFHARHPEVEIDLQPAHQHVALDRLLGYEVDAAVIASPVRSPQVRAVPILDDPLCLVCPPGTPAAPVRLADLHGSTLLLLAAGTGLHEQIETALREHGVAAHLVEYPTAETIKTAVGLGMGSTILPASAVGTELASARLSARPIVDWTAASRVVRLLVRAEGRPPASVAAFTRLLQQHYRGTRS